MEFKSSCKLFFIIIFSLFIRFAKTDTLPISYMMANASSSSSKTGPSSSNSVSATWISTTHSFFKHLGTFSTLPEAYTKKDSWSDLIGSLLKVDHIERGHVTCLLTVKPSVSNGYGTFHGGVVASVAEWIAIGCARTVVAEDKELFLGELSISYLSAAYTNTELEVDGKIVRSGRNVTVTSIEFRIKETRKLVYTARATFYITPLASL